jgi:hypothetical protein
MARLTSSPPGVVAKMARIGLALALPLIPGTIMAQEHPLSAPLTVTETQGGVAGETGTVWTIAPDYSFTIARRIGLKVLDPHKHGHLAPKQSARLGELLDQMVKTGFQRPLAPPPQVNPHRITLSYGSRQLVLTLPPGGGDIAALRASTGDERAKSLLDLTVAVKDMLGR